MKLLPYSDQVTGDSCLLTTEDRTTIFKAMNRTELDFYLHMDHSLRPHTPEFRGIVDVTVSLEKDEKCKYEADFEDGASDTTRVEFYDVTQKKNLLNPPDASGCFESKNTVKYTGLEPNKLDQMPGFQCNKYTKDVKSGEKCVSDVGRNPWVRRVQSLHVQRMGRHEKHMGGTLPYILLENLGERFRKPCVLDLKIGTQMYGRNCDPLKRLRHLEKNRLTTTSTMGIRLAGLQVYEDHVYTCRNKYYGKGLNEIGLKESINMFFMHRNQLRMEILNSVVEKVSLIRSAVSRLDGCRLYGCSLVVFYEGDATVDREDKRLNSDIMKADCSETIVRVVDFANCSVAPSCDEVALGGPDCGFVQGLTNLIQILTDMGKEEDCAQKARRWN